MVEDYDIDFDPAMDGDSSDRYAQNLPKVLDPVMTVQVVQKFMNVERKRNSRALLWLSSIFLFVIVLVLALFAGIGMHVITKSSAAARVAATMQAETAVYATEVLGLAAELERISADNGEIGSLIQMKEDKRLKEGRVIRTDLERFGRWVESRTSKENETINTLSARLNELESRLEKGDIPAQAPVTAVEREPVEVAEVPVRSVEPVVAEAPGGEQHATVPELATEKIDGQFDIALAEPVRVAVPVPPLDR
jgi:hypothetical protein